MNVSFSYVLLTYVLLTYVLFTTVDPPPFVESSGFSPGAQPLVLADAPDGVLEQRSSKSPTPSPSSSQSSFQS